METPPGRGRSRGPGLSRALASIALAMLILVSAVGAGAGVALVSAGAPDGMVGIPNANIVEDYPTDETPPIRASDLHGSVMTSKHAETLELTVTTSQRARGYVSGAVIGSGDVALVLTDDVNHDGRRVALPAKEVEAALGYVPTAAYISNEDGSRTMAPVEQTGGLLVFEVPHFSSNVVTFSGEIQLTGSPAVDGAQYSYTVSDLDAVENFTLDVTGSTGYNWDNYSSVESDGGTIPIAVDGTTSPTGPGGSPEITLTGVGSETWDNYTATKGDGENIPIDVGGNLDPTGPASGSPEITLTGIGSTTDYSPSGTAGAGDSASITVGGNIDPTGPASGSPEISVTAHAETVKDSEYSTYNQEIASVGEWNGVHTDSEAVIDQSPQGKIEEIAIELTRNDYSGSGPTVDIYINKDGAVDGVHGEGTLVKSGWNPGTTTGTKTVTLDTEFDADGEPVTVEFVTTASPSDDSIISFGFDGSATSDKFRSEDTNDYTRSWAANIELRSFPSDMTVSDGQGNSVTFSGYSDGQSGSKALALSKDATALSFSGGGGSWDWSADYTTQQKTKDVGIDYDGDAVDEITHTGVLDDGETASYAAPLSTSDSSLDISTDNSDVTVDLVMQEVQKTKDVGIDLDGDATDEITHAGVLDPGETATYDAPLSLADDALDISTDNSDVDIVLSMQEVTETTDPAVEVNGNVVSHSGTLTDGETVSLNTSTNWVQEGTNQINISVTSPGGSAAPGQVGFNYRHEAVDNQSVTYQGEKWSERYNVSKTYSSDRQNATLTVPFDQTVYSIRSLEVRTNGGAWDPLTPSEYSLSETTLTAQLGEISAGDTIEVRAVGSKVSVNNGAITVTDPTPVGESLDSGIRIDDWNNDSYIAVGGTEDAHRVHYLYNETWNGNEHAVIASNGGQQLVLPAAEVGGIARVSSIPLKAEPLTGEVWISVSSPSSTEPTFEVAPGANYGDDVEFTHLAADSGTSYILYSESDGIQLDAAEVGEPAVFEGSDREGTLVIRADSSNSTSTGPVGTGPGGFIGQTTNTVVEAMPVMNPGLIAVLVLAIIGFAVAYTERRTPDGMPVYRRPIVLLAVGVAFVLGILLLAPDAILGPVRTALSATLPLAGIAGVLLVAYLIYSWRQEKEKRASTPQQVFELVGREK
ncbi:hypothetical protein [Haladaptatus sp. CMSO5]|uniref:hypothetical protein n=1 Tax=Haladaptatus sp. CMSO5 TaxID=3120514 RepID=UPI002FCE58B7